LTANATKARSWIAGVASVKDTAKMRLNAVAAAVEALAKPPRLLAMIGFGMAQYFL
jgi:hypothetical protein